MGLDWLVNDKPRPGREAEAAKKKRSSFKSSSARTEVWQPASESVTEDLLDHFRGNNVGLCTLLDEDLQNEAWANKSPIEAADYAARIERAALLRFAERLGQQAPRGSLSQPSFDDMDDIRAFCETWDGDHHDADDIRFQMLVVLDGARWLRYWADLGPASTHRHKSDESEAYVMIGAAPRPLRGGLTLLIL